MGQAIWDYYHNNSPQDMLTETNISKMDIFRTAHLFRDYENMPEIEQKALDMSWGKVLDVGAGAGSHSLYLQNQKGLEVTALDVSQKSIEVCRLRGIKKTVCTHLLDYDGDGEKFDTILLMMNGTGIFEEYNKIGLYLRKLYDLLNDDGQILIDGSDIIYMYGTSNGATLPADRYYGEVDYHLYYKGEKENDFKWLYLDYLSLEEEAETIGLTAEVLMDEDFAYLARLKRDR